MKHALRSRIPSQGRIAARAILRALALTVVTRIDHDDADLRTLAEQCRQAGGLALAELDAAVATAAAENVPKLLNLYELQSRGGRRGKDVDIVTRTA